MTGVFAREHKKGENRINADENRTGRAIMSVSCAFPLQHWQSRATGMMVMRDCLIKMFVLEKSSKSMLVFIACDYESSAVGMRLSVHHWSRELSSKEELLYIHLCGGMGDRAAVDVDRRLVTANADPMLLFEGLGTVASGSTGAGINTAEEKRFGASPCPPP